MRKFESSNIYLIEKFIPKLFEYKILSRVSGKKNIFRYSEQHRKVSYYDFELQKSVVAVFLQLHSNIRLQDL